MFFLMNGEGTSNFISLEHLVVFLENETMLTVFTCNVCSCQIAKINIHIEWSKFNWLSQS